MIADVRDETGRYQALANRLSAVLNETGPLIQDITRLPLTRCTVRLLHPAQWQAAVGDYVDRGVERPFVQAPATPEEQRQAAHARAHWRSKVRWRWPFMRARTITDVDGEPETITAPDTLRHTGLDKTARGPERMAIHEAVHHAQTRASGGMVIPLGFGIRPTPYADRAAGYLMESHADWAELQVSYELLGDWPEDEMRRTSLHTPVRQALFSSHSLARARWYQWRTGKPAPARPTRDRRRALLKRDQPAIEIWGPG